MWTIVEGSRMTKSNVDICLSPDELARSVWKLSIEKKVVEITNHTYQPKHEILSKTQANEILKKYNTKPSQLPYIMINDKGIADLDVRPGDIIKITRKSATAGESVYYRYVVEAWVYYDDVAYN